MIENGNIKVFYHLGFKKETMNDILNVLFNMLNREDKRKKLLFINFTKQKVKKLGIKNYECIAICGNKLEYNQIKYNCNYNIYFSKIFLFDTNEFKEFYKNMKFDIIIMNPPYGNPKIKIPPYIHNQIYNTMAKKNKTICIMPCNKMETIHRLKSDVLKTKEITKNFIFVPSDEANNKMHITTPNDLGIFSSFLGENGVDWETLKYKGNLKAKTIMEKFFYNFSIKDYVKTQKITKHYCKISENHGHTGKNDELDLVASDFEKIIYNAQSGSQSFNVYFSSKNECKNFHASLLTKCMKFIRKYERDGIHIYFDYFPFMTDYSKPWDDKRFCEYFGITGYIDDEHAEPGSEWETILNTMKEYK